MESRRFPGGVVTLLVTALAPISWGTTYLVTTQFLPPGRPLLAALVRALPVGLLLMALFRRLPHGKWWWRASVLGFLNFGFFFMLLFMSAYRLPGGVAATAGAVQPLIVAFLARILLKERLAGRQVTLGLIAVVGVGLLVLKSQVRLDVADLCASLGATASMALGTVLTRRWGRPVPLLLFTAWQLVAGGLFLLPFTLLIEGLPSFWNWSNLAGFSYLAVLGTGAAYALWFRGIERLPVVAVTFLGLFSPLTATLVGWLFLAQGLTPLQIAGAGIALASVVLGQLVPIRVSRSPASSQPVQEQSHLPHHN